MFSHKICFVIIVIFGSLNIFSVEIEATLNNLESNDKPVPLRLQDSYWVDNKIKSEVVVKLYYECLCPDCIEFDTEQFSPTVQKLAQYVDFYIYPYGNAKTIVDNGTVRFKCQHGPKECYGNKLHACALDYVKNYTQAIIFNSCMMGYPDGSTDDAAEECGKDMSIDPSPIISCAQGEKGTKLLQYYGEESKKANFKYVPYILVNGKETQSDGFMQKVCAEFPVPPPPCTQL